MTQEEDRRQEDLLRDVAILDLLKKEEEENYRTIIAGIRKRCISRILIRVACSSAAAIALALALHFTFRTGHSIVDEVEMPTLISDSGESVRLGEDYAYTLELSSEENSPITVTKPAEGLKPAKQKETYARPDTVLHAAAKITSNTVIIPKGYTYNIRFDDGTEAYINSGSYIEFPKSFAGKEVRKVSLTGEAYFKVAKSQTPFIVSAGGVEVKVYGTEFNVNTNKKGKVETILVSGSVGVRQEDGGDEVMMSPDQLLTYDTGNGEISTKTIIPSEYLSWMRGDFTYSDRPLFELLDEISSFYNIDIRKDKGLENQSVTINLSRKLGHKQIIEILEPALGLEFTETGNKSYKCKTNN